MADLETSPWASESLSKSLPVLRDSGESQNLEFKAEFPQNGWDLAKEIAAFATSQGGTILIGVGDKGELLGLPKAETADGRDEFLTRLAGICKSNVKPSISPSVGWGIEDKKIVMAINVPEGMQPIYYSGNVPYIRHLSTCRPAEPHEVEQLVIEHHALAVGGIVLSQQDEAAPAWVETLVHVLMPVLIFASEADQRMLDPWLSIWRAQFKHASEQLREMIAENSVPSTSVSDLKALAKLLEEVALFRLTFGCGPALAELVNNVRTRAEKLWTEAIEPHQLAFGGPDAAKSTVTKSVNQLNDLGERANDMLFGGQSDEFMTTVSIAGVAILQAAILFLRVSAPEKYATLFQIGRDLHLVETKRLYLDGGQSQTNLMAHVGELRNSLVEFLYSEL